MFRKLNGIFQYLPSRIVPKRESAEIQVSTAAGTNSGQKVRHPG